MIVVDRMARYASRSSLFLLLLLSACGQDAPAPVEPGNQKPGGEIQDVAAPAGPSGSSPARQPDASELTSAQLAGHNRALGLMGQFDYEAALGLLSALAEAHPERVDLQIDRAIATLNRQQPGDESRALAMLREIVAAHPEDARAVYCLGLLQLRAGELDQASVQLQQAARLQPNDAYVQYFLGQILSQQGQAEAALAAYRRAMKLDPNLRSAQYGAFGVLRGLGDMDGARAMLEQYRALESHPQARLAEYKYTRMGPLAEVRPLHARVVGPDAPEGPAAGPLFDVQRVLIHAGAAGGDARITIADVNGDGQLDLLLSRADAGEAQPNQLLLGQADGSYRPWPEIPWADITGITAPLWGDFDNDGRVDLFLGREGPDQLWMQQPDGSWQERAEAAGLAGGDRRTLNGLVVDADHDGDLDLWRLQEGAPVQLLANKLDGSFRLLDGEFGLDQSEPASLALTADLDRDRDLDLLWVDAQGRPNGIFNERMWNFRPARPEALEDLNLAAGLFEDRNADGYPELLAVTRDGSLLRRDLAPASDQPDPAPVQLSDFGGQLASADFTGDGRNELLLEADGQLQLLTLDDNATTRLFSRPAADLHAWRILHRDAAAGPSLVLWQGDELLELPPGPGRGGFLRVALSGREDSANAMRSNASGLGAQLALRLGERWSLASTLPPGGQPGQDLQPLSLGMAGAERADFVAITWSDGVFQTELGLPAGHTTRIQETQRQLSSCPVLFVWDGEKFHFVSDLLGVGGVGYAIGRNEYAEPRPREAFLLPDGLLQAQDGRHALKITEPMEEAAYIDQVELEQWDLPPGWRMFLDERMGILGPQPTGASHFYRKDLLPVAASNGRGESMLDALAQADGRAVPVGELDHRFIGRLREPLVLELSFDQDLDASPGAPWLLADGWVEYPYSQTMFAAWQAGAGFQAPSIEARGADGRWRMIAAEFGYPAGMPRLMAMPLTELPPGTRALRITSNMEIYWDRLRIALAEDLPQARSSRLPLAAARLADTGFARRTTFAQRRPFYDYARRAPLWDTRAMPGFYTRFGPVDELVTAHDDAVAIIGPGEELHLEFTAANQSPPAGWTRQFVLHSRGWAKDMDLFTRDGDTLGPLPVSGQPEQPRDRLNQAYQTRYKGGF